MSENINYSISDVEDICASFVENSKKAFIPEDIVNRILDKLKLSEGATENIDKEVRSILESDLALFKDPEKDCYTHKGPFFKGGMFCITPTSFEIKNGILFPGDRFSPFCDEDIFPSEVEFIPFDHNAPVKVKDFKCSLIDAVYYHNLLGSEQMFNYFIADNRLNSEIMSGHTDENTEIILTVFDMAEYYDKYTFKAGDALKVTIRDWATGEFSFDMIPGEERKKEDIKEWNSEFEKALQRVFDVFGTYIEIPEQLAQAYFFGTRSLLESPCSSIEEFQAMTEEIEISLQGGHTVLAAKMDLPEDDEEVTLPEGVMISKGETSSPEKILKDISCPLKMAEIESYMFDELFRGTRSYDNFYSRCFGLFDLAFADSAQEVVFMNFIEDKWEVLSEKYNPAADENKGEMRSRIMDITDERLQWLCHLRDLDVDTKTLSDEYMEKLAEISFHLGSLLEYLNSEESVLAAEDMDEFSEKIESLADIQETLLENLNIGLGN